MWAENSAWDGPVRCQSRWISRETERERKDDKGGRERRVKLTLATSERVVVRDTALFPRLSLSLPAWFTWSLSEYNMSHYISEFISKMFKKHFLAVLGNEPTILYWGWSGDLVFVGNSRLRGGVGTWYMGNPSIRGGWWGLKQQG